MSGDGFDTKGGGSAFGYSIDFGASATADYRGYIEEMHGIVTGTVFGLSLDFMRLVVRAQMVPDYAGKPATEESGWRLELRHLGSLLHSIDAPATSAPAFSISFSKEAPDPEKSYQAFVGPVPVIGGASVAGNFGFEYEYTFTANTTDGYMLGNSVGPFANIEGTVFAGVGTALFSAGVEGVLTLLDERITLFSGTEIPLNGPEPFDLGFQSGIAEFVITQGQTITNYFTGPRGTLNLFAKYTVPAFRKCSWGFFTGLCPTTKTLKATKTLWRSPALFQFSDVLFEKKGVQLDVVVIKGQEPAYYVPP
jgi:hypothetical protein